MKKIFSLLMVAAIVLTMSLTSFAADTVSGMETIITETDTDITITVKVGNVVNMNGITTYVKTTAVTYVADSYVVGEKVSDWTVTPTTDRAGFIKFVVSTTDSAKYITEAGDFDVISYKVIKADSSKELSAADFTYGTGTLDISKVTTPTGGTVAGIAAGNNFTSKKQPSYFTVDYIDNRKPAAEDKWEAGSDADLTSEEKAAWDDAFKFKTSTDGEDEATGTAPAGKKLVIFAKNATAKTLTAGSYGVRIGNNDYPGRAAVDNGKAWAIIILDENGKKVAKDSYNYTAYVGSETVFSGSVDAQ